MFFVKNIVFAIVALTSFCVTITDMKRRTERRIALIAAVLLLLQIGTAVWWVAFRPRHRDLIDDGTLRLVTESLPGTRLRFAHASAKGATLNVHGRITGQSQEAAPEQVGTVHLIIESADGHELERRNVEYQLSALLPKGGGGFSVNFPFVPAPGSILRIRWEEKARE